MLAIYKVMMNRFYFLNKKRMTSLIRIIGVLFFCVGSLAYPAMAQKTNATVKGIVKDATTNESLPGVNVLVKGTTIGTATNKNGKYQLSVPSLTDTLVFSYIGYKTEVVAINGKTQINVNLTPQTITGQQLVVIGYGSIKQSDVSGAISEIQNNGLGKVPVISPGKALMGKIAGVQIQNTSSEVGNAPTIRIRGVSSITTSSAPLVVVDGYPVPDGLNAVDMADVANISVLKGAAAAAIYGSRASNGVIIITTKKGTPGKTHFHISAFTGVNQAYPTPDIWPSPKQWYNWATAYSQKHNVPIPSDEQAKLNAMLSLGTYTNWQKLAFRNGLNQKYHLSGSGGNKNLQFFIGAGFQNNQSDIITNYYQKYSINSQIDAQMNKWLKVGMNINGSYSHKRLPSIHFQDMVRTAPWLPVRMYDTTLVNYARAAGYDVNLGDYAAERYFSNVNGAKLRISSNNNSLAKMLGRSRIYNTYRTSFNLHADAKILPGLHFKTSFGGYFKQYASNYFQTSWSYRTGATEGQYAAYHLLNWLNQNTLTYHRQFGKNDINLLAGLSEQANSQKFENIQVSEFASDLVHTLNGGSLINSANTSITQSTLASTFFRVNYSFANKYIAAVSTRWDGSSRFGANRKWGNFPSASVAWLASNENFLKNSSWISQLKLRASYGAVGNNNIGDYSSLAIVNPGYNYVLGSGVVSGFTTSSIANPNLQWEKTSAFDAGIDFGMLDGRISMSADYYNKQTIHMLLQEQIPAVTGFNTTWTNAGKIRNVGFEFDITSHNFVRNNFEWTTTANFYTNKNTVLSLAGPSSLITTPSTKYPMQWIARVGQPLAEFYGYVVDRSKGDNGLVPRGQLKNPYWPIGVGSNYAYVKDINHDGKITAADRVPLGNPYPKFNWSVTNEFNYKNFSLSFMFQGSEGAKVYNLNSYYWRSFGNGIYGSNVKDLSYLVPTYSTNYDVMNASFIALRTLSVGYELPAKVLEKMHFSSFRIYFNTYNLLYFMAKGYTGENPEGVNEYTSNPLTWGYQKGSWPVLRSFTFGIDVKI